MAAAGPPRSAGDGDADRVALFLDFDGTLVDIAPTPDAVRVEPAAAAALERLRLRLGGALAIVTGRPVADIDRFLPTLRLDACGLHGLERRVAGRDLPSAPLPDIGGEIAALRRHFADVAGVVVEGKRVGVAVHWRLAPDAERDASAAMTDLAARLGPGYRLQDGKAVRELVPAASGKGAGIRALMAMQPYHGRLPVFAGDDRTDEDGFAAVNEAGGVSVKVGSGPTTARFRVAGPDALRACLTDWAAGAAIPGRLSAG